MWGFCTAVLSFSLIEKQCSVFQTRCCSSTWIESLTTFSPPTSSQPAATHDVKAQGHSLSKGDQKSISDLVITLVDDFSAGEVCTRDVIRFALLSAQQRNKQLRLHGIIFAKDHGSDS